MRWSATQLAGCDEKTVPRYMALRAAGRNPLARLRRERSIDPYLEKVDSLIEFVRQLRSHFQGDQVILIWDGLPSHRSEQMRQFLAFQARGQRPVIDDLPLDVE